VVPRTTQILACEPFGLLGKQALHIDSNVKRRAIKGEAGHVER
jgi:hypothetical protein